MTMPDAAIKWPRSIVDDLLLPTLLFAALGGMSWAVRGSSGYGAMAGCIFAGVLWGVAWWYLAFDPNGEASRRYSSAWIVLAVTVGLGISGARGWMQWPSFFEGRLQTNYAAGEFVPIGRGYGFAWLFIAGVPWAGIGACLLAWCGSLRETRAWHWGIRLACGIGGAFLARYLFDALPQFFLPLYGELQERYQDLETNPNLRRLINDSRLAIMHLGCYLGLLGYEAVRREGKNVILILTVGLVNGAGWSLLQNWKWAPDLWPGANFNWWRCWESSGGISIGVAYGLAYFLVNRRMTPAELAQLRSRRPLAGPSFEWLLVFVALSALTIYLTLGEYIHAVIRRLASGEIREQWNPALWGGITGLASFAILMLFGLLYCLLGRRRGAGSEVASPQAGQNIFGDPNLQRLGLGLGLLYGLGLSLRNGLKGWFNIYRGDEDYYSGLLWQYVGPGMLVLLALLCGWVLIRPLPRDQAGNIFPHAQRVMWLALVWQNALGQLVTGPLSQWNEFAFTIYYALLFLITAAIVLYFAAKKHADVDRFSLAKTA